MNSLAQLAALLNQSLTVSPNLPSSSTAIDDTLRELKAKLTWRGVHAVPDDLQMEALLRFWDTQELSSFRDVYIVSSGLYRTTPAGYCLLEDRPRLQRVLDYADGFTDKPSRYRRCYHGFVRSYFSYAPENESRAALARQNWRMFRDYLHDNSKYITSPTVNPDWVQVAKDNLQLFGADPCASYVDAILRGNVSILERIRQHLGIEDGSWFLRELLLAQIRTATAKDDSAYLSLLPRLLSVLSGNLVLRDQGLISLLDRYVDVAGTPVHEGLKEASVTWWGNPWLPSNKLRWGGVKERARSMVGDWLKEEIIETFFTKLAEDGMGERRRMNFWKRYIKTISRMEFALGSGARNSREPDFMALRSRMDGLICHLEASGANNAFIMHMGDLVAVEFSGANNAFYAYDRRKTIPFDTNKILRLPTDALNSLKQQRKAVIRESHSDGSWETWERYFERILARDFKIFPAEEAGPMNSAQKPTNVRPRSFGGVIGMDDENRMQVLASFAQEHNLKIDDKTSVGGNLWVLGDTWSPVVNSALAKWGFQHKPGKGWWKNG